MKTLKRNLLERRLNIAYPTDLVTDFNHYLEGEHSLIDYLDAQNLIESYTRCLPIRTLLRQLVNEAYGV